MRSKKGKRFRAEARVSVALPQLANEMWTMDYAQDQLGGNFRTLNLVGCHMREALTIELESLPGFRW